MSSDDKNDISLKVTFGISDRLISFEFFNLLFTETTFEMSASVYVYVCVRRKRYIKT